MKEQLGPSFESLKIHENKKKDEELKELEQ